MIGYCIATLIFVLQPLIDQASALGEQRRSESMDNIDFALPQSYSNSQVRVVPFPNEVTGKSPIFCEFSLSIYISGILTQRLCMVSYTLLLFYFLPRLLIVFTMIFLELKFIPLSTILFVTMDSYVSSLFWLVC